VTLGRRHNSSARRSTERVVSFVYLMRLDLAVPLCFTVVSSLTLSCGASQERAADKPLEPAVLIVAPPPVAPAPARPIAVSHADAGAAEEDLTLLQREVAESLLGFTATSLCTDFDYYPEGGIQNFWCHRPASLSVRSIEQRATVPIFLSGPHKNGVLKLDSKTEFGHYNPAFVRWLASDVAPRSRNSAFRAATQSAYDHSMKPLAEVFYRTRVKIRDEPACFAREKNAYAQAIARHALPAGYYEHWFFFMNPEFCKRSAQTPDTWYFNHGMDGGVDGNVTKTVVGFWIRRALDTTMDAFAEALDKTIAAYEPDLLTNAQVLPSRP
jgi:hypothetical protein